jgi:hypothetical protein
MEGVGTASEASPYDGEPKPPSFNESNDTHIQNERQTKTAANGSDDNTADTP